MNRLAWLGFLLATFAAVSVLGCRKGEEPTYDVSGTVTINGAPLKDGFINFESEPPDGFPPGSAQINDGAYATKSRAGNKKVSITANKPTGEKDSGGFDITVNWLPAEYNSKSDLKAEITPAGPNQFDFKLKK